jgi:hypothetical protein
MYLDLFGYEHLYKILFDGYRIVPSSMAIRDIIGETDELRLSNINEPESFYDHLRSVGCLRSPMEERIIIPRYLNCTSPAA